MSTQLYAPEYQLQAVKNPLKGRIETGDRLRNLVASVHDRAAGKTSKSGRTLTSSITAETQRVGSSTSSFLMR